MQADAKTIGGGLAVLGVLGGAVVGYVKIQTPEAAKCAVDLSAAEARVEMLTEIKDTCKVALEGCAKGGTP